MIDNTEYTISISALNANGESEKAIIKQKTDSLMTLDKYKINAGYIRGTIDLSVMKAKLLVNGVDTKTIPTVGDGSFTYYANDKILSPLDIAVMVGMDSKSVEIVRRTIILDNWTDADLTIDPMTTANAYLSGTAPIGSTVRYSINGVTKTLGTVTDGTYKWSSGVQPAGNIMKVELREGSIYNVSKEITVQTIAGAPTTPTGLTLSSVTATTAKLTWTAVAGATSYKLYQNGYDTVWKTVTTNSVDLTGTTGSTWTYRIAATNAVGDSYRSNSISLTYL